MNTIKFKSNNFLINSSLTTTVNFIPNASITLKIRSLNISNVKNKQRLNYKKYFFKWKMIFNDLITLEINSWINLKFNSKILVQVYKKSFKYGKINLFSIPPLLRIVYWIFQNYHKCVLNYSDLDSRRIMIKPMIKSKDSV